MKVENMDGYTFWREILGAPRHILAPMVEQSELPWRLLSRRYGAELCYTPMLHSSVFTKDLRYRKENLLSCPEDRPLIVQFCANDAKTFVEAAKLAQDHCEAIDLNLGCPQTIAQRGHYGAFLENEWDLLREIVTKASTEIDVPITCKIRVFKDVERTVNYAQMLEKAGCKILTVHGRTKEQKGPFTGIADWDQIKAVKSNVSIPVFANGNIQYLSDVEDCLRYTGVDGVMTAEGNLHNPALFKGVQPPIWKVALEYLEIVDQYPCPISCVRGHLFKILHHSLTPVGNHDLREVFASAHSIDEFRMAVCNLKFRYEDKTCDTCSFSKGDTVPPWICQPYVRPPPKTSESECLISKHDSREVSMSTKKLRKLVRKPQMSKALEKGKKTFDICSSCPNPKGMKCDFNLCKACCKIRTSTEILNCFGHKLFYLQRRQSAECAINSEV